MKIKSFVKYFRSNLEILKKFMKFLICYRASLATPHAHTVSVHESSLSLLTK